MGSVPVFVINLDRSPDRLDHMREQLARIGIAYERTAAVDGALAGPEIVNRARPEVGYRPLRLGEIGCFASHVAIWRRMVDTGIPVAVVLEDDIEIADGFTEIVAALASTPLDFVRLSKLRPATGPALCRVGAFDVVEDFAFSKFSGTGAYLIRREAARKLLARAETWKLPVDDYMDRAWLHGVRTLELAPLPVSHTLRFGSETLAPPATPKDRTPLLPRLQREVRRAWEWVRWAVHMASTVLPDHAARRLATRCAAPTAQPATEKR